MNETYYVKIQGKANIPKPLAIGHNYRLVADCSITSETKTDNDDGTFNVTFKVEPITIEIQRDNGETIKAKDPRKNSVKIRNSSRKVANDYALDEDKFYNFATARSIGSMEGWAEELKKLLK